MKSLELFGSSCRAFLLLRRPKLLAFGNVAEGLLIVPAPVGKNAQCDMQGPCVPAVFPGFRQRCFDPSHVLVRQLGGIVIGKRPPARPVVRVERERPPKCSLALVGAAKHPKLVRVQQRRFHLGRVELQDPAVGFRGPLMIVSLRQQIGEPAQRDEILGLSSDDAFDQRNCFAKPRLEPKAVNEEHDCAKEARGSIEDRPQPRFRSVEVPVGHVDLSSHGQGEEILRLLLEK